MRIVNLFCLTIFSTFCNAESINNHSESGSSFEEQLFNELFINSNYSPQALPIRNKSRPVQVQMNIAYKQLVDLNDREQILKSNIWIRQFWMNEFMRWDPSEFGGLKKITVSKEFVWKPDIVLYNSADESISGQLDQYKTRIIITYTGQTTWYIPTIVTSSCSIDIKFFPFDYQRCTMKWGSWSYLGPSLNLTTTMDKFDMSFFLPSTQFHITNHSARRNVVYYSCCPEPYIDVTFSLVLKRQPGYYIYNIIMPTSVITFFALFIFAFPETTGERMGLAIQCFLTTSILTMMVSDMIPIDSNVTPLLAKFMILGMIFMTMSIIMNTFCFNLPSAIPVPAWLHDIAFDCIGPLVTWNSCSKSVRKRGICDPTAFCVGIYAAIVNKRQRDVEQEELEKQKERYINLLYRQKLSERNALTKLYEQSINLSSTVSQDTIETTTNPLYSYRSSRDYVYIQNGGHDLGLFENGLKHKYSDVSDEVKLFLKERQSNEELKYLSDAFSEEQDKDFWDEQIKNDYESEILESLKLACGDRVEELLAGISKNARDVTNISYLAQQASEKVMNENTAEFWRCVSQTTDRMFFIIFMSAWVFIAIALFIVVPVRKEQGT